MRVHAAAKPEQIAGALLNPPRPQPYLESRPASVAGLHDGIHFKASVLSVVEDLGVGGLGVHAEVADDHRLEEKPEEPEVPEQSPGIGSQRGRGQGRIDEMADRTLAKDRPRAQVGRPRRLAPCGKVTVMAHAQPIGALPAEHLAGQLLVQGVGYAITTQLSQGVV